MSPSSPASTNSLSFTTAGWYSRMCPIIRIRFSREASSTNSSAFAQRLAPHPLRHAQRFFSCRVEPPRRRVTGVGAQRLHDVLERHGHVFFDVAVGEIPAARAGDHLEHPLPALALGER